MEFALFILFALIATLGVVGVIVSTQIVRACVYLLVALLGVGGLYLLLGAEFLAAVQLIIYVGGTLILIVFGVMLTATRPTWSLRPRATDWLLAGLIGALLMPAMVIAAISIADSAPATRSPAPDRSSDNLLSLGELLVGRYALAFELAAVILLVVMIGAAYLARAVRRRSSAA